MVSYFTEGNVETKSKGTYLGPTAHKWLILGALGRETRSPHQDLGLVAAV